MTELQVIAKVQKDRGLSENEARELINYFVNLYVDAAMETGSCAFGKIGHFQFVDVAAIAARVGRNPRTGAEVQIAAKPARKKLKFKLSKAGGRIGA